MKQIDSMAIGPGDKVNDCGWKSTYYNTINDYLVRPLVMCASMTNCYCICRPEDAVRMVSTDVKSQAVLCAVRKVVKDC